jgi:hypothetical protein
VQDRNGLHAHRPPGRVPSRRTDIYYNGPAFRAASAGLRAEDPRHGCIAASGCSAGRQDSRWRCVGAYRSALPAALSAVMPAIAPWLARPAPMLR